MYGMILCMTLLPLNLDLAHDHNRDLKKSKIRIKSMINKNSLSIIINKMGCIQFKHKNKFD